MNKIYKVVWSKVKNCYVVASELAKRRTKGSGARGLHRAAVTLGVTAALVGGISGSAWAALSEIDKNQLTTELIIVGTSGDAAKIVTTDNAATLLSSTLSGYTLNNAAAITAGTISGSTTINTTGSITGGTIAATTLKIGATDVNSIFAKIDGSNLGSINTATWATALGTGTIAADSDLLVKGSTVYNALDSYATKAGAELTNVTISSGNIATDVTVGSDTGAPTIGSIATKAGKITISGETATFIGNVTGNVTGDVTGNVTATTLIVGSTPTDVTTALTTAGAVAETNAGFVTGGVVYSALGDYVKTDATNITDLNNTQKQNWANALGNGTIDYDNTTNGNLVKGSTVRDALESLSTGQIAASGETRADKLVKGFTVYDYLNGTTSNPKLALGANSTNISIGKDNTNTGTDSWNNEQTGTEYIAIGQNIKTLGNKNIAIGTAVITQAGSTIAIGEGANAMDQFATAIGSDAKANNYGTVAVGYQAYASGGNSSTAVGNGAYANGMNALAIGGGTTQGYFPNGGRGAQATANYAIAVGYNAKATQSEASAIGSDAKATANRTVALGSAASASASYASAIGSEAKATWSNAVALGHGAEASIMVEDQENPGTQIPGETESATALGAFSKAQSNYATAVGANAKASGLNSIAIGGGTRPDTGTITAATAVGEGSIAIGKGANTTAAQATAVGMNTSAVANGTAIGYNAKANKNTSTAIGYGAKADGNGENATAIGYDSSATGNTSIAIAGSASASLAIAVGRSTSATAERAIGIGVETTASGVKSIAIGSNSSASLADSVALGSGAVTTRAAYATENYNAYLNEDGSKTPDTASTETKNAWRSTHGAVAVGNNATVTRQITGVAAGSADTDAVNVAQLKSATPMINDSHNYYNDGSTLTAVKVTDAVNAVDKALGKVAAGSNYLTEYNETTPTGTFADNLKALDTALGAKIADDGTYNAISGSSTNSINANIRALDTAIGTLQTNTAAAIGTLTDDGNYIKKSATNNVSQNLAALDTVAGTFRDKIQNITAVENTTTMKGVLNVSDSTSGTTGVSINGTAKTITAGGIAIDGANNTLKVGGDTGITLINATTGNTLKVGSVTISDNGTAKTITGLSNTAWDADNITSGQAATEDQLKSAITSMSGTLTNTGLKFTANSGGSVTNKLGSTVSVIGGGTKADDKYSDSNVKTVIAQDATGNSTITVKMDENPSFTSVTATGNISGKDITASGMLSSATLKVGDVDVTIPLTTVGKVESGNAGFVTGGTVYSEVRPAADGNYVKTANTTAANLMALDSAIGSVAADGNYIKASATSNVAQNLTALDTQVKTNADNIAALQSSTTASVGTIDADGNYIKKSDTNTVSQNLIALDTQMKTNADNIAANQKAIGTTADGSYVKAAETVGKNLNALDTQVKTNTDDIATLKNSISVQEDASGTKTTTIDGNLVIKEQDGTTKDVTAALTTEGEVAKQGETGSEGYLKGETVYDYLNKGENGKEVKLAKESKQIAVGQGSVASGVESIAIGNETGGQRNEATGLQSIAIGFGNQVTGAHSGAIGDPGTLDADNSYMIGNNNNITESGTAGFILGNDNVVSGSNSYAIGSGNNISGSNTFVMGHNVNASVDNAVVLGTDSTAEANAVSVGSDGNKRQIKHVAPGKDADDAVTVGQVAALAQNTTTVINQVDSKLNKVGAGAAALAALHPIDTDDKFTMGIGYGNYRSAHSAAIGMFYRPTDKIMLSVGGAVGNGENMINAGISFALDKGKGFGTSKAAMARKIAAQDEEIKSLKLENSKLEARLAAIEAKLGK